MALTVTGPITITYSGGAAGPASTTAAALAAGFVIPTMPVGGGAVFTAPVNITGTVAQNNTATVATPPGTNDPTPANNTSTASTSPVLIADVQIVKTRSASTIQVGVPFTYTLVATNNGPSPANASTIADTLPADFTPTSQTVTPAGGAAGVTGTNGNYTIATFPNGASVTFTITGTFATAAVGVSNTATISVAPGVTDNVPGNNSSTVLVDVTAVPIPQADLSILKTINPTTFASGGTTAGTISLVVSNAGPAAANGAVVTDNIA